MTITVEECRLALIGIKHELIEDETIENAIESATIDLQALRKANVSDTIFDRAVLYGSAHEVALLWSSQGSRSTLGYSESGMLDFVKNLEVKATFWRKKVVKKYKGVTD